MASQSKPYQLSWEVRAKTLEEVNDRITRQLYNANEMLEILYTAVKDLTTRVEVLEP